MRQNLIAQSGNRVVVEFDGNAVGLLQSINEDSNYGLEDVTQIGDIHVAEHVPTVARHSLSFSRMELLAEKMRAAGLVPENGDVVLQGNVFDVVIYSKDTGAVLRKIMSLSYDSGRIDINANRIVVTNGTLKALDVAGTGL